MSGAEYQEFEAASVAAYAERMVKTGSWTQKGSLAAAQVIFRELLPDGAASSDNYLFTVRDGELNVAFLWFAVLGEPGKSKAHIYNIVVNEKLRGQGYGRAAMLACIEESRELGAVSVRLRVFGDNHVARSLYTSLGFEEVEVVMSLPPDSPRTAVWASGRACRFRFPHVSGKAKGCEGAVEPDDRLPLRRPALLLRGARGHLSPRRARRPSRRRST